MEKNFISWPDGWPKSINYPEIPVYECLDQTAKRIPGRLSIIFGGMELTFAELKNLSLKFAAALESLCVVKGDRVAIHLPNSPQFAIAYYGLLRIGAVFTPMSPLMSAKEAEYQLNDSGAKILVSLDLLYPSIKDILGNTQVEHVITTSIADCYSPVLAPEKLLGKIDVPDTIDMVSLLKEHKPDIPAIEIDVKTDLAHLAYTGGTTGLSKGVMLTHYNVMANSLQFSCWMSGAHVEMAGDKLTFVYPPGVDPKTDRVGVFDKETALAVVPWFHAMGAIAYLNTQVISGNTMVVFPRFEPREYIDAVGKYNAYAMGGAPQLYIPLLNLPDFDTYDLSGIRLATSGAAPLPVPIFDKLLNAFSGVIIEAYGLTECSMGAIANPPIRELLRPGSVGIPIFDTECKIIDIESGEELPTDSEGELCIKGPQVMQGYWNNPEETARVLNNGWLHTGDIARQDETGYFYITDRIKDMIIYKGYNVFPRDLEEVLIKYPAVEMCAIVGKPSDEGGEIPVAFVQLKQGQQTTADDLMSFVNNQVAPYKKIREVFFQDQLPVSAAGKILKKDLRKLFIDK
ncbi:MAG: AMP-binding protein [Deltaproteobacteria bacterium]|nr:AMP-binding protein [Deltaproteobacteria bacterium]